NKIDIVKQLNKLSFIKKKFTDKCCYFTLMMDRSYIRNGLVMLSMFDKFFGKKAHGNHKANEQYIYSSSSKLTPQEAQAYWVKMAQKLVVGAINSVDHTAERIFILISFNEDDST